MPIKESSYHAQYVWDHYERIIILTALGTRDALKDIAKDRGCSVNSLIVDALEKVYDIGADPKTAEK